MEIVLTAEFKSMRTTIDGGINITFAVSQDETQKTVDLMQLRDKLLCIAIVPINQEGELHESKRDNLTSES